MCVTGCPYKKIYFNHNTGKAEKCTFCYPRIEVGLPTVCSETCVGRLRYLGLFLYDADRVTAAARRPRTTHDLYEAQLDLMLDPNDPEVVAAARRRGHPRRLDRGRASARRSTRWPRRTGSRCRCTRSTGRCRWSGTSRRCRRWSTGCATPGHDGEDVGNLFGAIDALRIPVEYLAELFTAGDTAPVTAVLQRLAAMRSYMRGVTLDRAAGRVDRRRGRDDRRRASPRCTGCWRSPSTRSAT